ncbi:V-set and transmembrane domain-containing protein 5, partial [Tachyglossus aculeatus]|uniref:V-set and transmembrane domain-containing protein 5 n=1 Tax=Tachyglossus aculeatus TaxID=9261 RepID=UPI0018F425EB
AGAGAGGGRGALLGVLSLCLAAGRCLHSQEVSLYIPHSTVNATVDENILLSVDYSCQRSPTIEWQYTSSWGMQKIVTWRPGTAPNISRNYRDRVCTYDNGSIQLLSVGVRDTGYYVVTITEDFGDTRLGTIVLNVNEILYEDLHFVAVFLALLTAMSAVLISLMWVCNKCAYKFQTTRKHRLKESTTEEIELQTIEC